MLQHDCWWFMSLMLGCKVSCHTRHMVYILRVLLSLELRWFCHHKLGCSVRAIVVVSWTLCAECVNCYGYVSCSMHFQSFLWISFFENCCLNYPEDIHILVLQASKYFLLKHVFLQCLLTGHNPVFWLQYESGITDTVCFCLSFWAQQQVTQLPPVLSCQLYGEGSS